MKGKIHGKLNVKGKDNGPSANQSSNKHDHGPIATTTLVHGTDSPEARRTAFVESGGPWASEVQIGANLKMDES